jgi:lysine 2,3-aminomutase
VIDAPGGGGKVPVNPDYVLMQDEQRTLIRNYQGEVFEYPEPGSAVQTWMNTTVANRLTMVWKPTAKW